MDYGTKLLLVRYGQKPRNCMELHIEELNKSGLCWFGKIGIAPSIDVIQKKIGSGSIHVILYCQSEAYLCECCDIKNEKPDGNYPKYYDEYLFEQGIQPKIYFALKNIERIENIFLSSCVILSSRNYLSDTLKRSMASFFYVEYVDPNGSRIIDQVNIKNDYNKVDKRKNNIDMNDCLYRKEGYCTNRHCISFQYECTRPSSCVKQKWK